MSLLIVNTTILTKSDGKEKELLVQYVGKGLSVLDYISGTVKMKPSFAELGSQEQEEALLGAIKKEFFPEPFNADKLDEVSHTVEEQKEILNVMLGE